MKDANLDDQQHFQEGYYKKMAARYDTRFKRDNPNHIYKIESITDAIFSHLTDQTKTYSLLEIGAGTGIHANYVLTHFADRIGRYMLTDLSLEMLQQAQERLSEFKSRVEYLVTPAEHLQTQERFDAIFMSGAMHHFSNPYLSLVGFKEHLTDDGILVVCEPIISNPYNFINAISTGTDWGQFHVTRSNIRRYLQGLDYEIFEDRVLHYKTNNRFIRTLLPHGKLEQVKLFDSQAIMFLLAAIVKAQPQRAAM
jgi:ubiquinone/menaquinone biosynthesis C-methylase UbiE